MIWGGYKLYGRYLSGHFRLNITTVCIVMELLCCVCRQIGHLLAVLIQLVPYIVIYSQISLALYFLSLPFTFSAGIFLIFFWIDITSKSLYHGAFLDKAFWPAMILVIISFIIVSIAVILIYIGYITSTSTLFIVLAEIINALMILISLIYFIAASRVNRYTKERKDPKLERPFHIMMIKIVTSGVLMIIIVVFTILFQLVPLNQKSFVSFVFYVLYSIRSFFIYGFIRISSQRESTIKIWNDT